MIGIIIILLILLYIIYLNNLRGQKYFRNTRCKRCTRCNKDTTERFTSCVQYASCESCKKQCQKGKGPYPFKKGCGDGCWAIKWGEIKAQQIANAAAAEARRVAEAAAAEAEAARKAAAEAARKAAAEAAAALEELKSAIEPFVEIIPNKITSLLTNMDDIIEGLPQKILDNIQRKIKDLIPELHEINYLIDIFKNPKEIKYKICIFWQNFSKMEMGC